MRAGQLRHRITIERRVATKDGRGQPVESWATLAVAWAKIEQTGGREKQASLATTTEATWTIETRFIPGVTADCRIKYRGRILDLVAPPTDANERGIKMLMLAKDHQPAPGSIAPTAV